MMFYKQKNVNKLISVGEGKLCKVSILMSVYNSEISILKKVIYAINNQSYKDFEVVIINDGSTNIELNNFLEKLKDDKQIKLVTNTINKGLIYSLNKGIVFCEGTYIARFDDDDIPSNTRLDIQVKYLEENPDIDAVGGWADIVAENGKFNSCKKYPNAKRIKKTIAFRSPISHSLLVIKKDKIKELGGYDNAFKGAEDYALFLKMLKKGCHLDNVQEVLGSQKFTFADSNKRNRTTRFSVMKAKIRFFNFKTPYYSLIGVIFSILWFLAPQIVINQIYKKDIVSGIIYD